MTIAEAREKCKNAVAEVPRDVLGIAILVLASSASFGLGLLAGLDVPVPILQEALSQSVGGDSSTATTTSAEGRVVASKNGTKYYLSGCAGADRISEANKVWFASPAAAAAAGYAPA